MKIKIVWLMLVLIFVSGCGDSTDNVQVEDTVTIENTVFSEKEDAEQNNNDVEAEEDEENSYMNMSGKVVVLGDSLWGLDKGPEGIAGCLEEITSLEVKNFCIPGTCASRIEGFSGTKDSMISILVDNQDARSEEIRNEISESQYVFIEHCNNDYSMGVPTTGEDNCYEQALLDSISVIKELNPEVQIVMILPTLGYLINMEKLTSEYDSGSGTIDAYIDVMKSVAEKEGARVVDMQKAWTLTKENWSEYLVDGAHLKKEARREYAAYLAQELNRLIEN